MRSSLTVNGQRRVDRCNNVGGRASVCHDLVLWITNFCLSIEALLAYMDNTICSNCETSFGFLMGGTKQEFGPTLVITGFVVDPSAVFISLDSDRQAALLTSA